MTPSFNLPPGCLPIDIDPPEYEFCVLCGRKTLNGDICPKCEEQDDSDRSLD